MGCGCSKRRVQEEQPKQETVEAVKAEPEMKTLPTEQCIACAQKHMDEAYMLYLEYGYSRENARLCRGNLRAIVLHTYRDFPEIAALARECALGLQDGEDVDAKMHALCDMIDGAFEKTGLPQPHV